MSSTLVLAAAGSRLGALQRGRGAASRELLTRPPGLADVGDVLTCILADPRVDRQVESRGRYYAELVAHVGAPVVPLLEKAAGDLDEADAWLCADVLQELVRAGYAATDPVRDQIRRLGELNGFDTEEVVGAPRGVARRSFVDSSLATAVLLQQATPWNRRTLVNVLSQRRREHDRAVLAAVALSASDDARLAAWEVLARIGDERLLDNAVELLRRHAGDSEIART
jgi:hypothetical protein